MGVPTYLLGNSQLYQVATGALGHLFERLSRKLRMSINIFHGAWGTLLPYPVRLATAFGDPIDTREVKEIDVLHSIYCRRVRDAFEKHKEAFGWKGRRLFFQGEDI